MGTTTLLTLKDTLLRDPLLSKLSTLAKREDAALFLVGGYLRDLLIGVHRRDYDLALSREASFLIPQIEEIVGFHFFKVGKKDTITYRIIQRDMSIDLTYLQGETIKEDLGRRDFTMNAIAFCLRDETFHSPEGALEDIERQVIRSVSHRAIDQDPLRMLRAIRYLSTFDGFRLDALLMNEITLKKHQIDKMPGERLKMEMDHILLAPHRDQGLSALHESGLLLVLFPELRELENLRQGEYHHLNTLSHTLLAIEKMSWAIDWCSSNHHEIPLTPEMYLSVSYAALFHDLGKQDTHQVDEKGKVHFYHHESFSCRAAEGIMDRLRFSWAMRDQVLRLIQYHMRILNLSRETKDPALKRLVNQAGDETPLLVLLTLADKEASRGILSVPRDDMVEGHCLRILEFYGEKDIVHPLPWVTGSDVMRIGYAPGPKVGQILRFIQEKQVTGEVKTRDDALRLLKEEFGQLKDEP